MSSRRGGTAGAANATAIKDDNQQERRRAWRRVERHAAHQPDVESARPWPSTCQRHECQHHQPRIRAASRQPGTRTTNAWADVLKPLPRVVRWLDEHKLAATGLAILYVIVKVIVIAQGDLRTALAILQTASTLTIIVGGTQRRRRRLNPQVSGNNATPL